MFRLSIFFLLFCCSSRAEILNVSGPRECDESNKTCWYNIKLETTKGIFYMKNEYGQVLVSYSNNQLFECGGGAPEHTDKARIMNEDGTFLYIENSGGVLACGTLNSNGIKDSLYYILDMKRKLRVFDKNAKTIFTKALKSQGGHKVLINDKEHYIWVPPFL